MPQNNYASASRIEKCLTESVTPDSIITLEEDHEMCWALFATSHAILGNNPTFEEYKLPNLSY